MTKILVIEDAHDLREDVIEMLKLEGYKAYGAENGISGVATARQERPDLIVCDIMMPELDGYGVLEKLRENPETATIPFIFLTAKAERMSMRQGMVLGADDYLTKPFMVNELLDSIETQLKKRTELNEAASERIETLTQNIITALPHELRTPLNTIIGFSDILLSEAQRVKPDQVASWAEHINGAAHRLYHLIENYLYYAQFQLTIKNNIIIKSDEPIFGLSDMISIEAENISKKHQRTDDLELNVDANPDLFIDHKDAKQVISELVENAFKFSEAGQTVHVTAKAIDGGYELAIQDHGCGMKPEQIRQIAPFMQFDRYVKEQQGLGLGLAIVESVAKAYGYEFHVDSEFEVGTTVTFKFKAR